MYIMIRKISGVPNPNSSVGRSVRVPIPLMGSVMPTVRPGFIRPGMKPGKINFM